MKKRVCFRCKQEKSIEEFKQYKTGINKGYCHSYCISCSQQYKKDNPWQMHYGSAYTRTHYPNDGQHRTYKKLEFNMTPNDFKDLWFRDRAYLLKKPSIDRIEEKKGYIKSNCRFIEFLDNIKLGHLKNRETIIEFAKNRKRINGRFA